MDVKSLTEFKSRLKDFEQRLLKKEQEHQDHLAENASGHDDLGLAREAFETIIRDMPEDHETDKWDDKKHTLNRDMTSLIILFSQ